MALCEQHQLVKSHAELSRSLLSGSVQAHVVIIEKARLESTYNQKRRMIFPSYATLVVAVLGEIFGGQSGTISSHVSRDETK